MRFLYITVWTIVLSVVLGLTTIIMVVDILIILVFINRKKKSRRRGAIPPPPPYTSDPNQYGANPCPGGEEEEPSVSLPASGGAQQSVAVQMRPPFKYPIMPPPYAGQEAPAYETVSAGGGATGGRPRLGGCQCRG